MMEIIVNFLGIVKFIYLWNSTQSVWKKKKILSAARDNALNPHQLGNLYGHLE